MTANSPSGPGSESLESVSTVSGGSVARNTAYGYMSLVVQMLTLFILTPFIIKTVGVERFGIWSLVWSIVGFIGFLHTGMSEAVIKFIGLALGRKDVADYRRYSASLFWGYTTQGTIIAVVIGLLSLGFGAIFKSVAPELGDEARTSLLVLGLATAATSPLTMYEGVTYAHRVQWRGDGYGIALMVLYALSVWFLLPSSPSVVTLAWLNAALTVSRCLVSVVIAWKHAPALTMKLTHATRATFKEIYGYTIHFALITSAHLIATRVDTFIVEAWLDVHAVAIYALAMRINSVADMMSTRIQRVTTPLFAELKGRGDTQAAVQQLLASTRATIALTLPFVGGGIVLANPLVEAWVGKEMAGSGPVTQVLLLSVLTGALYEGVRGLMSMDGEHRVLSRAIFFGQLLNLGLSMLLVRPFGLIGVAVGTVVGMLPMDALVFQKRLTSHYQLKATEFLSHTVQPSVVPAGVALTSLYLAMQALDPKSLWELALLEMGSATLFFVIYWFASATPAEREYVSTRVRARRSR